MKKLLIGTNNPSKLAFIRTCLKGLDVECVSPSMLNLTDVPAENERTAPGNARQKALAWHKLSGLPVITEDSGLIFLDLPLDHPDQPGILVRRAAGHMMDDVEMLNWYMAIIRRHGGMLRAAWADAWCFLADAEHIEMYEDSAEKLERHARQMISTPSKTMLPGWPLDSLTWFPALNKYKSELTIAEMHTAAGVMVPADREELIAWMRQNVIKLLEPQKEKQGE